MNRFRPAVSSVLALSTFLASAGLAPYQAAAQVLQAPAAEAPVLTAVPAAVSAVPGLPAAAPLIPPAASLSTLASLPSVTVRLASPAAALSGPRAALKAAAGVRSALASSVSSLAASKTSDDRKAVLSRLFGEGRKGETPAAGLNAVDEPPVGTAPAAPETGSLEAWRAAALDPNAPQLRRIVAVHRLKMLGTPEAKDALLAVGRSEAAAPGREEASYEVQRAALADLAELGRVESLPAVTAVQAGLIKDDLKGKAPSAVVSDYDGTLEALQQPASKETGALLKALAGRKVKTMILTDRSDAKQNEKDVTIHDSLAALSPAEKANLVLGANRGAKIFIFNDEGKPLLLREEPKWTLEQEAALKEAGAAIHSAYGKGVFDNKSEDLGPYSYSAFLPPGRTEADVQKAARDLQAGLRSRGIEAQVTGRMAYKAENPPYLVVSKFDKSLGVTLFRQHHKTLSRLMTLAQAGVPDVIVRALGRRLLAGPARLGKGALDDAGMVLVGDGFFGFRNVDADMTKGAPRALTVAVGGTADPRLINTFVWPKQGPEGTRALLRSAAGQDDPAPASPAADQGRQGPAAAPAAPSGGMNKKAIIGLFISRTLSISCFVLTSITYPFIVLHAPGLGAAALATLMALGPLASVAMGPINGVLVSKLSARNSMAINTLIRAVLAFDIPLMMHFGILNFWVLLVSSIANSWLLSSTMITEGAYIRKLAGPENVETVNALFGINYNALQVIFGLLLVVGQYVDKWPVTLPYNISTFVHLLLVLPVVWFTIPNIKNASAPVQPPTPPVSASAEAASPAPAPAAPPTRLARFAGWVKLRWKEMSLMAATIALEPVLHTTLPITAALLFWISRTDSFKALWAQKNLRSAMLLSALGAFLTYPLQYFALPNIALAIAGAHGKAALFGQMIGALMFGQLIANSSQASKLPKIRIPFTQKRIGLQRIIQVGVLDLAKVWLFVKLFHGSVPLTVAGIATAAVLMWLSEHLTNRGWIKLFGFGLAAVWLPILVWGNVPVLFAAILTIGMFTGPVVASVSAYFQTQAREKDMGKHIGIQGSFFNGALSFGYGFAGLVASLIAGRSALHTAYPGALVVTGIVFALGGVLYWFAPRHLPGLAPTVLKPKTKPGPVAALAAFSALAAALLGRKTDPPAK